MIVSWPGPDSAPHAAGKIHYRFEIRLLSRAIVGRCPEVRILRIAWEDKLEHLQRWLETYYHRHRAMPRGCHDLGTTPRHRLQFGVVNFDAARARLAREREFRRRCERLPHWLRRLSSAAFPVLDAIPRMRWSWRERGDTKTGRRL